MKKRFLIIVLTLCLLISTVVSPVALAEGRAAVLPTSYKVTVTVNTGVQSILVQGGLADETFTSSGTMTVPEGRTLTWTATPKAGYEIAQATGTLVVASNFDVISPTASLKTYSVTITVNTGVDYIVVNGNRYTSSTTVTFNSGANVSWVAYAKTGYTLSSSSGSFTVSGSHTIAPTASLNSFVLTVTVNSGVSSIKVTYGSNSRTFTSSGTLTISHGTAVSWSATAATGYSFTTSNSGSFTMSSNQSISPSTVINSYTLTVTVNSGVSSIKVTYGSSSKTFTSSGTLTVSHGTAVSWTATAATGYNLSSSSGSFTMTGAKSISPTASIKTYSVTITLNAGVDYIVVNGTRYTSNSTVTFSHGQNVSWNAYAKTGYTLASSSGSFTMNGAKTIAPTASLNTYTLTVTVNSGVSSIKVTYGSSSRTFTSSGTLTISHGTTVSWTATAATGYNLSSSSGNFTMTTAKTVSPTATLKSYTLTVTVNTGVASVKVTYGSSSKTFTSSGTLTVSHGTAVSWTATAASGYNLPGSSGNFTMTAARTVAPTATVKSFTVVASWTPSNLDVELGWTLAWSSGKALAGDASDYVTMQVASDGKSVSLTFKKNFAAGEMLLTCYVVDDPTVKATCTVKCGS